VQLRAHCLSNVKFFEIPVVDQLHQTVDFFYTIIKKDGRASANEAIYPGGMLIASN